MLVLCHSDLFPRSSDIIMYISDPNSKSSDKMLASCADVVSGLGPRPLTTSAQEANILSDGPEKYILRLAFLEYLHAFTLHVSMMWAAILFRKEERVFCFLYNFLWNIISKYRTTQRMLPKPLDRLYLTISSFPNFHECWYNCISIRENVLYFFNKITHS
jgi:hypothetical protein